MLNPHACHHRELREIKTKGSDIDYKTMWWCVDCNVRCWHDGSDIGHYFDFKDRTKEYCLDAILPFLLYMYERLPKTKSTSILIERIKEDYKERNPQLEKL